MNSIARQARKIAIPSARQVTKINKNANEAFKLVSNECNEYDKVVSIQFGGSYAKGTWTPGKIDVDIFVKLKKSVSEKKFSNLGKKIGFNALKKYKPYIRYSEHPFVEALVNGTLVNVVPCYDVKQGEWKSATDRSTFHTEFMNEKLSGQMKDDIRILKCFLNINEMYGAEIAKQGFSGYVCEVLVYYLGSFENVLKKMTKLQKNEMIGESPRKFESPMVIIDPIDMNRNLGAAISMDNVTNFILVARNFLKKNSISYFKEKMRTEKSFNELNANMLFVHFKYKKRSDDIIYGQIKRATTSIESQLNKEGFNVLRTDTLAYDDNQASLIFLLQSLTINRQEVRTGPEVFLSDFSSKFIHANSKKSKLMWIDKDGKIKSIQTRRYENAKAFLNDLIKNHLGESGIPKGLRADFKTGFKIVEDGALKYAKWTSAVRRSQRLVNTDDKAFSTN